ncbi:hypothetical protein VZT92_012755 [Zoarces viviparus]|uniref:Uncharacterized protein n=1 Tax=Zoarces viviparus TaxID=48416 RepID=A0AAW1F1N2_ZOAVI
MGDGPGVKVALPGCPFNINVVEACKKKRNSVTVPLTRLVRCKDCETAGSLMTFFLVLGLALGASFSFLLGKLV